MKHRKTVATLSILTFNLFKILAEIYIKFNTATKRPILFGLVFLCVWVFGGRIRKAGPSKQSSGLFARPWLFRRKANPPSPTKNPEYVSVQDI
jgi:hypothetical protein